MTATRPPALDLSIEHLRRERRLLGRLALAARVLGFSQIGAFVWFVFIQQRLEPAFVALSLSGTLTNLSTLVVHRVRCLPEVVHALVDPRPDVRARAAATVEAHRHEVLSGTDLPASIHEPDLVDMDVAAIAERVAKNGPYRDWRRIGRWWLTIWALAFAAVMAGTITLV